MLVTFEPIEESLLLSLATTCFLIISKEEASIIHAAAMNVLVAIFLHNPKMR